MRTPRTAPAPGRPRDPQRGAVLIVTLLIVALIALGIGSYLTLNLGTARIARQSYQQNAAFHLAESGAEEALWSFNRATAHDDAAWNGWARDGTAAWKKFQGFDFGGNTAGTVKVYVRNPEPAAGEKPAVIALASVGSPGAPASSRMIQVNLSRRSYFGNGLMARESVRFAGLNATVDSWNSDPDGDPATPAVAYSEEVRSDNGSVATLAVENTAMLVNQAAIWGHVATGGAPPEVGVLGSIRGADTPADVRIDASRVSTNFTATLPGVEAPADGIPIAVVGATLGTAGQATSWRCPAIILRGNQTLTIRGDVTLVLTSVVGSVLDVTGNAGILIPRNSSLRLYVEGDLKIAGNGLGNGNARPVTCQIWGTNNSPAGQSFDIAGNGALKSVVYAPNADVRINGNGDIMGAVVGRVVTLTGNADFHYDESLADYGEDTPFKVIRWRELNTAAERAPWLDRFSGW